MKEFFDFLEKWLSPKNNPMSAEEDLADSLILFAILCMFIMVILKS